MMVTLSFDGIYLDDGKLLDNKLFNIYKQTWETLQLNPKYDVRETPYFKEVMKTLGGERGEYTEDYVEKLIKQMVEMRRIFASGGYDPDTWGEYPAVIFKDGKYVLCDGLNRLSILHTLGFDEAKFIVVKDCYPYHDVVLEFTSDDYLDRLVEESHRWQPRYDPPRMVSEPMNLYLPINHPNYVDRVCSRFDSELRLNIILDEEGDPKGKRFLDVGCNTGFFSIELATRGAQCVGVDPVESYLKIARFIAHYHKLRRKMLDGKRWLKFYPMSVERFLEETEKRFNYIIFFGLFHHLLRQDVDSAWETMDKLSERAPVMFFETALTGEPQMEGLPELRENTVIEEVLKHSTYKEGKILSSGFVRDWKDRCIRLDLPLRPIYKFWR